ncbi:MAG: cytochrome ubiquinol oxidase subunit I [Pseudomonadota bacterium]|jgi:cytochrome d ubiquinol oxidase subunit I
MDPLLLARAQFAANITFHILFPSITIALGWALMFFRWRWRRTQDGAWLAAYRFWTKVFALTFALGVVSGVTMSFQFGTNWPGFMERAGNVAGPLLGYEVLTAFFLEAGFLGIMLFGHGRVSERVHTFATFFVAFGTTVSAFWILVLNSWMQTPAGHEIVDGVFHVRSWAEVLLNPSFPYRFTHVLLASGLTCAFLMAGVSAWQLLRGNAPAMAPKVLRVGLSAAALLIPVQIFVGDLHGLNTFEHQPQKVAAMEGVWQTQRGAPLLLFAWPDEETRSNRWEVGIPRGASLVLTHEPDGEIKGLDEFKDRHPPVAPVFWAFRVMVGVGMLMLIVSWAGWWLGRRARWAEPVVPRWMLWTLVAMTFSGWLATVAGWYVTEIGRQPYMVYGLLRVADVASNVPGPMIAFTLTLYVVLYLALLVAYVLVLKHMAEKTEDTSPPVAAPRGARGVAAMFPAAGSEPS